MADGLIINYTHGIPPRMLELIRTHHAPAVWVNTKLESDCVYPDDLDGSRRLIEHLLAMGHRRVAFVKFDFSTHYSDGDRRDGYEAAMAAAGLPPRTIHRLVPPREQLAVARSLFADAASRPTAIITRPEDVGLLAYASARAAAVVVNDLFNDGDLDATDDDGASSSLPPPRSPGAGGRRRRRRPTHPPSRSWPTRSSPRGSNARAPCCSTT